MSAFIVALLVMSCTFGLWRARITSNWVFAAGVAAVVICVLAGMTWMKNGVLTPDGAYQRYLWPVVAGAWVLGISRS